MYGMFKRKIERYVECLFYYFKQEEKMHDYYKVFTLDVVKVFNDVGLGMPEKERSFLT